MGCDGDGPWIRFPVVCGNAKRRTFHWGIVIDYGIFFNTTVSIISKGQVSNGPWFLLSFGFIQLPDFIFLLTVLFY